VLTYEEAMISTGAVQSSSCTCLISIAEVNQGHGQAGGCHWQVNQFICWNPLKSLLYTACEVGSCSSDLPAAVPQQSAGTVRRKNRHDLQRNVAQITFCIVCYSVVSRAWYETSQ